MNMSEHIHYLEVCAEIGGISECNGRYTAGLSERIAATGKAIEDLTVRELLELHRQFNEFFNAMYAPLPPRIDEIVPCIYELVPEMLVARKLD